MRRSFGAVVLLLAITGASAQEAMPVPWANKFFVQKDPPAVIVKDFGTVPQGTQLTHRFPITNIYAVPIQVGDPRVSCGCTSGTLSKHVLQPRETAYLDLVMDARKFVGNKAVTVWVDFGPKFRSTAVLRVQANSRADIALNPGRIDFGVIAQGRRATQSVELQYLGGMPNWQVIGPVADEASPVDVAVQPTVAQRGRVVYVVTAALKADAPPGPIQAQVQLQTNDQTNPIVAINVGGTIQAPFNVYPPGPVRFDEARVGQPARTHITIQGTRPFLIQKVEGEGDGVTVELPRTPQPVQVVKINFQPTQAGALKRELRLYTDPTNFLRVPIEGAAVDH